MTALAVVGCCASAYASAAAAIAQDKTAQHDQPVTNSLKFPPAQYKDFAMAPNSGRLTAIEPNVHYIGPPGSPPEAQVIQDRDGYSEVNLPYLGIELNIPFGWGSFGGYEAMKRMDFFPDPEHKSSANLIGSSVDLGIKVLNSSSFGNTGFQGVLKEVQSFSSVGGKFSTDMDEQHHAFLIRWRTSIIQAVKRRSVITAFTCKTPTQIQPSGSMWTFERPRPSLKDMKGF